VADGRLDQRRYESYCHLLTGESEWRERPLRAGASHHASTSQEFLFDTAGIHGGQAGQAPLALFDLCKHPLSIGLCIGVLDSSGLLLDQVSRWLARTVDHRRIAASDAIADIRSVLVFEEVLLAVQAHDAWRSEILSLSRLVAGKLAWADSHETRRRLAQSLRKRIWRLTLTSGWIVLKENWPERSLRSIANSQEFRKMLK
jgi:hypothetical protein